MLREIKVFVSWTPNGVYMKILVYSREDHAVIQTVESVLSLKERVEFQVAATPKAFKQKVGKCLNGETILVFFIYEKADMDFLESVEIDFIDIKLVISLAVDDRDLMTRAYKLHPRLVTGNCDSKELLPAAVNGILTSLTEANEHLQ